MEFLEYLLEADTLYLGERPKGEIFKPCIYTIPFSQITGALNRHFSQQDFKATGHFNDSPDHNQARYLTYSPRDRVANLSKIPLQVEYLSEVRAKIFILINDTSQNLPEQFTLTMGGLRSRGFGVCHLTLSQRLREFQIITGSLLTRIPEDEKVSFAIEDVPTPKYGYLFRPKPGTFTGWYIKSLFEGSIVKGPDFLLKSF